MSPPIENLVAVLSADFTHNVFMYFPVLIHLAFASVPMS